MNVFYENPVVYAVKHKDEEIRAKSRSGGIFTALSDYILEQNGIVYGCVLDKNFKAIHVRAENINGRNLMRGSKYIQSNMLDCFKQAKNDLVSGKTVLFSGTSCQIAGLKGFLGQEYSNLLCVDIVCHGVPSPLVWKKYLEWHEKKNKSKVKSVDFRNKTKFGWKAHIETIVFENGKNVDSDIFKRIFYGHYALRPSCYKCPYKEIMHPADITIADYWGIDNAVPGFNDNKGVSLVLINNEKGNVFFENVKNSCNLKKADISKSLQPPLKAPFQQPKDRKKFWDSFYSKSFDYIVRKYGTESLFSRLKKKIKKIFKL